MLEKLNSFNNKKQTIILANALILLLIFHLLYIFAVFYSTKFNFSNPLIPQEIVIEVFAPFAQKGIFITLGLLLILPLKFFKQNFFVVVLSIITFAIYYLTSFQPDFSEFQK
ncbi:MAG: hypothetical protein CVU07_14055 [Bacteroidetes bacterium HGW-Bacteroidetes-23]|nr:MAG: hypothetical protein CVU07_14055 [Bacteroidetes bacterium HGW-Bacteroidetes-23]